MRATVLIREQPCYRREAFVSGLQALGYEITDKREGSDALIIWNRYGYFDQLATAYERRGAPVIVAENGYLGRDWQGKHWYALARSFHNGGGWWPEEPPNAPMSQRRWSRVGVELAEWRKDGKEIVVLATRGIGPQSIREPTGWSQKILAHVRKRSGLPVRLRQHPGEKKCKPLQEDLAEARAVVTWGSGGALKALLWGVPVFHGFPKWIGASAAQPVNGVLEPTYPARLPMFERLALAMWTTDEIATGEPFRCLLT